MRDEFFEWDDSKAASNLKKHNISFEQARCVFDDRSVSMTDDTASSLDEDRYLAIGRFDGRLLSVSYTLRADRTRILSARQANTREQHDYDRNQAAG
jgi:uncharacterized protein